MNPRIVIFVAIGIIQIAGFVVFLNTAAAEAFATAESLAFVQNTWVYGPLQNIKMASYFLLVPVFILDYLVYAVVSGVQEERQQLARMRRGRL